VTEFGASAAPAHTAAATAFSLKCRKRHLGDKLFAKFESALTAIIGLFFFSNYYEAYE
jgi:hypothetical protein